MNSPKHSSNDLFLFERCGLKEDKIWEIIPEGEKEKRKSLVLLALDKTSSIPKYVWKQYH